jgi:dynactin complex subunit
MTASPPKIGTRIFLLGYIGTIKFFGPVHGTTGTWLGVEWDDPQRGKHDGTKEGVRYFTCTWVAR